MNDLPSTFAGLARSGGHEVDVDSSAKGGYTLEDHTTDRDTLNELDGVNWDFVILQENSNIPRTRSDMRERMAPAARALDGRIKKAGAQTILFVTWASLDTLAGNGIEGFVDEQEQVSAGFLAVAEELDATVAPVGAAWARSLTQRPDLDLWQYDNVHANRNGTYLAACVFYAVIYGQSPSGLDYTAGLPGDTAQFLQRVAAEVILADSAIFLPTRKTRLYCSPDPPSRCHHPRDDQSFSSLGGLYLVGWLSHSLLSFK